MLEFLTDRSYRDCEGTTRRDFLKIGALGSRCTLPPATAGSPGGRQGRRQAGQKHLGRLALARRRADACRNLRSAHERSGRISQHHRRSDDEPAGRDDRRHVSRRSPRWPTRWPSSARSPTTTAATSAARTFVMTGYDNRNIDNGGAPARPSLGSIVARVRGSNHPHDRHADLRRAEPHSGGHRRPGVSRHGL